MSSRSIVSAASAVLVALLVVLAPRPAAAEEKRVVVMPFDGADADPFEDAIIQIVKDAHEYVSGKRFARAAKKVKGFEPDAEGIEKVARKLKAHGLVLGEVDKKKKGRYQLTLKLREGATGEFVDEEITITVKGKKLAGKDLKKVRGQLLDAIDALPDLDAPKDDDDDEDKGKGKEVAAAGDGDGDGDAGDGGDGDQPEPEDKVAAKSKDDEPAASLSDEDRADLAVRGRAVDVAAGLSFVGRNLSFALNKQVADVPQGYKGALVPALFLDAELYPMALSARGRGPMQNLGVTLEVERVIKINSTVQGMEDVNLPTTQQRFGIGALYRWNIGTSPTSPTIKVGVGFNKAAFEIDKAAAPAGVDIDIPNVSYTFLSPGVELRFPINPKLAALADARYLFVTALGEMQEAAQYGAASITAFDVDVGAEYKLTSAISARAGFQLSRFAMTFDGSGALTDRDGDSAQDVTSAADRYLGLYAVAGYLF